MSSIEWIELKFGILTYLGNSFLIEYEKKKNMELKKDSFLFLSETNFTHP